MLNLHCAFHRTLYHVSMSPSTVSPSWPPSHPHVLSLVHHTLYCISFMLVIMSLQPHHVFCRIPWPLSRHITFCHVLVTPLHPSMCLLSRPLPHPSLHPLTLCHVIHQTSSLSVAYSPSVILSYGYSCLIIVVIELFVELLF
ncbi:unnamed protein product [Sphenostylis stenocarpa]|uniref:Uncharacterized protein n=1 Tax=Sphenostylis stenocarpa TaxID=92480 RepID=A0AA86SHH4_9FABA|nr:unnamed protein product [Sphenostylis stenocarpa]